MEKIHAHRGLMNHLELLWPHQSVTGQEGVQRSITHVLHHHACCLAAHSVDGHNIPEFNFGYVRRLIEYSPVKINK